MRNKKKGKMMQIKIKIMIRRKGRVTPPDVRFQQ